MAKFAGDPAPTFAELMNNTNGQGLGGGMIMNPNMSAIPQYQPGAVVPVKISKKDRNKVVIDIKR
ncbi:MAG: hypothetical protein HZB29_03255 [Nitrospinae bacterium]|nr:hypothetical protein [Nitrospinota bacterium]